MTFTVDVHHHILPDFVWAVTNEAGHPVGGIQPPPWSKDGALSFLDDAGIDVAIRLISTPGVHTSAALVLQPRARRRLRQRSDRPQNEVREAGEHMCFDEWVRRRAGWRPPSRNS